MTAPDALPGTAWRRIFDAVLKPRNGQAAVAPEVRERLLQHAPVVWLLGKVQSGKTSIVRAVTGHQDAEVGVAFKPCTQHSRVYDFPEDVPVVRFLDTRGLEEVDYDPAEDLALVENRAHVVVAVARVTDPDQGPVLKVLRAVRKRHPDWAVVLVQTRLHDAYPDDRDHPPYDELQSAEGLDDLHRALRRQQAQFREQLPGRGMFRAVAVDLTRPEDHFNDPDYGLDALIEALEAASEEGRAVLLGELSAAARDARLAGIHPQLFGYATAAGASDLVPVMGFFSVPTIQGKMLHSIGVHYGIRWDRRTLREFAASLGSGTALGIGASFAARQLAKLVPIYGQIVGAAAAGAASAAVTYALGRAACYYLEQARRGRRDPAGVAEAYRGSLKHAHRLFRREAAEANRAAGDSG